MEQSNKTPDFDIRDFMDYKEIREKLMSFPTELSLFEITCILINNKINEKKYNNENSLLNI
jgi:hypothetical protein